MPPFRTNSKFLCQNVFLILIIFSFIPNSLNLFLQLFSKCLKHLRLQILQLFIEFESILFIVAASAKNYVQATAISGDFKTVLKGSPHFTFGGVFYKTKILVILVDNHKS